MVNRHLALILVLLGLAVIASGIGVVYAKYLSRIYFVELQGLRAARDRADIRWGQLQLEESTHGTYSRVESVARSQLGMRVPYPQEVVVLRAR